MKILKVVADFICKVLTDYFLLWCPKEHKHRECIHCDDEKTKEYMKYYNPVTRWK